MCVTIVYVEHSPDAKYKLILLNNRDEFLYRPTSVAKWEDGILAGRDEKCSVRGTWLCINAAGRIGNLLTITVPMHQINPSFCSRGSLPVNFVKSEKRPEEFCESLIDTTTKYNAFQILCFQRNENDQYEIAGLANHLVDKVEVLRFPPGIHGFGNSPSCKPFKKVQRGVDKMKEIVNEINSDNSLSEAEIIERLLQLATDKYQCFPDEQLKRQCGRSNELCRYRTAIFVQYPDGIPYGTRSHTIIMVDRNNRVTYFEKSMKAPTKKVSEATWTQQIFHFDLI